MSDWTDVVVKIALTFMIVAVAAVLCAMASGIILMGSFAMFGLLK